jgi:L-ascorbate metabolism protein UlaG (beta-lactamase superfamily)
MPELTFVGGATALLEYAGRRWLTDPTFSPAGQYGRLTKLHGPAVPPESLEPVDVVLLSHDQHEDNLDRAGREFLPRAGRVLTTTQGGEALGGNSLGMEPWSSVEVPRSNGDPVSVMAVPAQHGPEGVYEQTGPVIGFVLRADNEPTVYFSGDNSSLEVVQEIADRCGTIEIAILDAGAPQTPRFGDAYLTLTSDEAAHATQILHTRVAVPMHFTSWAHFTEGADALRAAFEARGIPHRLVIPQAGKAISL